jgi:hypothetical protein
MTRPVRQRRLRGMAARALLLLLAALPAGGVGADGTAVEALGGWEGDSRAQGYGFAGAGALIPAGPKLVVPLRALGSYLYYDFNSAGTTTRVTSPGVTVMGGIRFVGATGNFTVLGGGEVRQEHRTLDTPGATGEEHRTTGIVLQGDGDLAFGRHWRGYLFANYGGASSYLYGRAAMRYQVTNIDWKGPRSFFLGLEGVRQGNDESDAVQGGGFAEWNFVPQKISLVLRGGYKESWSPGEEHLPGSYFGISLYHKF